MVDHLGREIAQEAAGHAAQLLARQPPPAHATQVETLHRARERHIAQAAFFLDGGVVVDAALVGEHPLLQADHQHLGKLQALGRVHGHESDRALLGIIAVHIGSQGDAFQEVSQAGLLGLALVLAHLRHQLHQVLQAAFGLDGVLGCKLIAIA